MNNTYSSNKLMILEAKNKINQLVKNKEEEGLIVEVQIHHKTDNIIVEVLTILVIQIAEQIAKFK